MEEFNLSTICRLLADSDKNERQKGLNAARALLATSGDGLHVTKLDKLTLGLYYALWMTDGPLVFRRVAASIAQLHHVIENVRDKFRFFDSFFRTLSKGWNKLDVHRLAKFELTVRILTAEMLALAHDTGWSNEAMDSLDAIIVCKNGISNPASRDMMLCFIFIYVEELINNHKEFTRVYKKRYVPPSAEVVFLLIKPLLKIALSNSDKIILDRIGLYTFKKLYESKELSSGLLRGALCELSLVADGIATKNRKLICKYANYKSKTGTGNETTSIPQHLEEHIDALKQMCIAKVDKMGAFDNKAQGRKDALLQSKQQSGFLTVRYLFKRNRITEGLKKKLKVAGTINKMRIASIHLDEKEASNFVNACRKGKLHWQLLFYSMHKVKRLRLINTFKCARKLYSIYDLSCGQIKQLPPPKRTVNVENAVKVLKQRSPRASALNSKHKNAKKPRVSFFLQANQIATVPRKKNSLITALGLPAWV